MSGSVNLSSNTLAQYGHFVSGALCVVLAHDLGGWSWLRGAMLAVWVLIGIKEAFIDPRIETPECAGSGFQDWLWWWLGTVAGFVVLSIVEAVRSLA